MFSTWCTNPKPNHFTIRKGPHRNLGGLLLSLGRLRVECCCRVYLLVYLNGYVGKKNVSLFMFIYVYLCFFVFSQSELVHSSGVWAPQALLFWRLDGLNGAEAQKTISPEEPRASASTPHSLPSSGNGMSPLTRLNRIHFCFNHNQFYTVLLSVYHTPPVAFLGFPIQRTTPKTNLPGLNASDSCNASFSCS